MLVAVAVVLVFYLPSLVAFRYTAATQSTGFLTHPWRSWSFIATALTVPGDSRLKTSGIALRAPTRASAARPIDPHEVRLLFLPEGKPYTFTPPARRPHADDDHHAALPVRLAGQRPHRRRERSRHGRGDARLPQRPLLYDVRRDLPHLGGDRAGDGAETPRPRPAATPMTGRTT